MCVEENVPPVDKVILVFSYDEPMHLNLPAKPTGPVVLEGGTGAAVVAGFSPWLARGNL